jgi:ADP-heptose:LPS heptosyltransferase
MVLATGIIKAITTARPTITIDVLASTVNAAVLGGNPYVGDVITVDKRRPSSYLKAIRHMRQARYDAVVDSMVLSASLTVTLLACLSGARHRIGLAGRGNDAALTLSVPPLREAVHHIDRSAALLRAFGEEPRSAKPGLVGPSVLSSTQPLYRPSSDCSNWRPELFLTPAELWEGETRWRPADTLSARGQAAERRLAVNVSAGKAAKHWPVDRFITTIARIRESFPGVTIRILGLPQDLARMAQIARKTNARIALTPHYRQMMAVVACSDVVLTADTSVTHIASAFMKPAVVMFVGGGGTCYGPYGTRGRVISTDGPSLESLEAEPVIRALQELLAGEDRKVLPLQNSTSTVGPAAAARSAGGSGQAIEPASS